MVRRNGSAMRSTHTAVSSGRPVADVRHGAVKWRYCTRTTLDRGRG